MVSTLIKRVAQVDECACLTDGPSCRREEHFFLPVNLSPVCRNYTHSPYHRHLKKKLPIIDIIVSIVGCSIPHPTPPDGVIGASTIVSTRVLTSDLCGDKTHWNQLLAIISPAVCFGIFSHSARFQGTELPSLSDYWHLAAATITVPGAITACTAITQVLPPILEL